MKGEASCGLICWFILVLVSIILFGCSFSVLEVLHVGLKFNSINRSYTKNKIYGPGRYLLGLGYSLEEFPTTWQSLKFCRGCEDGGPISGRVSVDDSAVSVQISMTVYYKLRIERLPEIISFFPNKNWRARYTTIVKNAVAVTMSSEGLRIENFISDREYVAKCLGWAINERLLPVYSYTPAVYISEVALGSGANSLIDNVYLQKQIANRKAITSEVQGETQVINAKAEEAVSGILATMRKTVDDEYTVNNFTAQEYKSKGERLLLNAEGNGYLYLQSKMNFTQVDLLKFIYFDKLTSKVSDVAAGFPDLSYSSMVSQT